MPSAEVRLAEVLNWPTIKEMCRQADISINYGYALVWGGRMKAEKVCGQWRVSPDAIAQYLKGKQAR